jgi:hypothetical protein
MNGRNANPHLSALLTPSPQTCGEGKGVVSLPFSNALFLVIPKLAEESCDFSRLISCALSPHYPAVAFGKDFSATLEMTM